MLSNLYYFDVYLNKITTLSGNEFTQMLYKLEEKFDEPRTWQSIKTNALDHSFTVILEIFFLWSLNNGNINVYIEFFGSFSLLNFFYVKITIAYYKASRCRSLNNISFLKTNIKFDQISPGVMSFWTPTSYQQT
jgi:hypothetical protein